MDNRREPGETSSPDSREERQSRKKSSKKTKKRDYNEEDDSREQRPHKEHRHKKSKKSKTNRPSRSRSPSPHNDSPANPNGEPSLKSRAKRMKASEDSFGDGKSADNIANSVRRPHPADELPRQAAELLPEPGEINSGQRVESMSIEETNKVRAKLGLKPLQIDGAKNADGTTVKTKKQEDVHAPPVNLAEVKQAKLLQEKLQARKGKRQIQKKLSKVKPLGAGDDEEESAEAWAERMRREARQKALEREKLQAEQDEEEEKTVVQQRLPNYSTGDLKGLKVEHDMGKFQEGRDVILTLKDSGVLDEDMGDVLVSTALTEEEKLKRNLENRKKKAAYNPYETADEIDEFGAPFEPQLLKKYDEVIGGEQKKTFVIGDGGVSSAAAAFRQQPMVNLKSLHDLMARPQMLAKEYYTEEEMATKFKKVRKPKKSRDSSDKGAASKHRSRIIDDEEAAPASQTSRLTGTLVEEDDDTELQLALSRARRLKLDGDSTAGIKRERMDISELPDSLPPMASSSGVVYLDETSEFCRAVGSLSESAKPVVKEEAPVVRPYDEPMDMDVDMDLDDRDGNLQEDAKGGWSEVQFEAEPANLGSDEEEDGSSGRRASSSRVDSQGRRIVSKGVLDDEPTCERGVGAALNLIAKKRLLVNEDASRHPTVFNDGKPSSIPAQTFVIDDKIIEDDKRGRHDRYQGPTVPFREKAGYKPTFKLAYHDASGRNMNQKEAFRDLSHKFHGKGPGKMKTERRTKKYLEEKLLMEMSSVDTPLHTVEKMQQKQQELQTPYILLSGAASAKGPTPISKKSNY